MADVITEAWEKNLDRGKAKERADLIIGKVKRYHPTAKKVLELGSGLGFVLSNFRGFDKFGLDLRGEYVNVSKRIVSDAKFFVQNMKKFRIKENFDVIFTTNECINELKSYRDWESTFSSAFLHLNDRGLFILEMPTEKYLQWHKSHAITLEETPSGFLYDNTEVMGNRLTWNTVYFIRLKNGLYRVKKDNYSEFIYSQGQVKASLRKKFHIVESSSFNDGKNVIIVCRKK